VLKEGTKFFLAKDVVVIRCEVNVKEVRDKGIRK
jgi:hypothetical protein